MSTEKSRAAHHIVMTGLTALSFLAGLILIVGILTFNAIPVALHSPFAPAEAFPVRPLSIGIGLLLFALAMGIAMLATLPTIEPEQKPDATDEEKRAAKVAASDEMFTRYLIGIGYFLFVDAVVNMVAFAGIASSGKLNLIFPLGNGKLNGSTDTPAVTNWFDQILGWLNWLQHTDEPVILTVILMLSLGMAILGALFFFANALWTKFKQPEIFFDRNIFWGGLWFRLAEAIVFTIAVFLFLQFQGWRDAIKYMPMIALFIGMTVKSSEALIFGAAERLLASVTGLVQTPKPPPAAPQVPPPALPRVPSPPPVAAPAAAPVPAPPLTGY